ncbi:MAG: polysaccharide biosynthesis protein [Planctomycetota bacterium]|jgi:FlaA1/EpsC-like NDP-sugar epimerase
MVELKIDNLEDKEQQIVSQLSPPPPLLLKIRKPLIILVHLLAFALSLMASFLLLNNMRFESHWLANQYPLLLLFFVIIKFIVFGFCKQYRGWWRYVGISDLVAILRATLISTFIIVVLWFTVVLQIEQVRKVLEILADTPQSLFLLDMAGTFLLLAGVRMTVRLYYEEFQTIESSRLKRFLIIGAGNAGEALLREIHRMSVAQFDVVGFVDDETAKKGISIHGIPVLGTVEQLPEICSDQGIDEIAIAIPSATHQQLRRVIQVCEGTKIRFRTVPSITDIASGKFSVSQIRDVDINDLLGREVVELDLELIETFIKDKAILVTGAGGSIGSEMCRQICHFQPKVLLLAEQAENPLFYIERELGNTFPDVLIKAVVCNITDNVRVEEVFEKYKPQVVIHAAAHKHVPLMELNPGEAIKNNTIGTKIIADASDKYDCTNCVMISTDKAVNPTSIMGSSKRIAEMYIQDLDRTSETHFVTVRFGNVLGSEGSVVPIFKKQIAEGGPVTVTHPEMKRYFMTIPEASQLVLQAATMGKGGEIFVLDMGEPVKIVDLARELITLSGFKVGEDIEILYMGVRPGEKLFEELRIKGEDMQTTRHPKISIWKNLPMDRDKLRAGLEALLQVAETQELDKIVERIKELVPEYMGQL